MNPKPLLHKYTIGGLILAATAFLFLFLSNFFPVISPCDVLSLYERCVAEHRVSLAIGLFLSVAPWFLLPVAIIISIVGVFRVSSKVDIDIRSYNRYAKYSLSLLITSIVWFVLYWILKDGFSCGLDSVISLPNVPRVSTGVSNCTIFYIVTGPLNQMFSILVFCSYVLSIVGIVSSLKNKQRGLIPVSCIFALFTGLLIRVLFY